MLEIIRDIIRYFAQWFHHEHCLIAVTLGAIAITWLSLVRLGRLRKFRSVTTRHMTTTTEGWP